MKKGQTVMVYMDPLTQQHPEGGAVLVRCLNPKMEIYNKCVLESWMVRFLGEDSSKTYQRTILSTIPPEEKE